MVQPNPASGPPIADRLGRVLVERVGFSCVAGGRSAPAVGTAEYVPATSDRSARIRTLRFAGASDGPPDGGPLRGQAHHTPCRWGIRPAPQIDLIKRPFPASRISPDDHVDIFALGAFSMASLAMICECLHIGHDARSGVSEYEGVPEPCPWEEVRSVGAQVTSLRASK